MSEKERYDSKMAMIYEISLIFKRSDKTEYTLDEIIKLLDDDALAKEQEMR